MTWRKPKRVQLSEEISAQQAALHSAIQSTAAELARVKAPTERSVDRLQRRISWNSCGPLITVDWDEVRRLAALSRMQEAS